MKTVRIRSAVPIYLAALVWLVFGIAAPSMLLKLGTLLVVALISAAVWFVGSRLFPGKEVQVRDRADTGDAEIDQQIEDGRARLEKLQQYNDQIPDEEISRQLDRMKKAGDGIFDVLEKDISHATEVRRFMSYYLPTVEKVMADYTTMAQSQSKGKNISSAMKTVESSLDMIAGAFEKQLDSLYRDKSFDIDTDMKVLETILSSEGLYSRQDIRGTQAAPTQEPQGETRSIGG